MTITVFELRRRPFRSRPLQEQIQIVKNGPPRPSIKLTQSLVAERSVDIFVAIVYMQRAWVTGCRVRKCFFCWPCLLFESNSWSWNKYTRSIQMVVQTMCSHETTVEHIQAELELQMFYVNYLKVTNIQTDVKTHVECAQRYRDMFKRLIDVLCLRIVQEQPPCKEENYYSQFRVDDCIKLLKLLNIYDTSFVNDLNTLIGLLEQSPKIINHLTDAVTKALKLIIKKETHMSTFVSLIFSEHSEASDHSLLSTVVRYIKNNEVVERFIGFTRCDTRTSKAIIRHIENVLNEFDIEDRFLAYALDSGILPVTERNELVNEVKENFPFTVFVPWNCHKLEYIVQQNLCYFNKHCKLFFKNLNAVASYFHKNSKKWKCFEQFMTKKYPDTKNTKWFNTSEMVAVMFQYRRDFVEFFDSVVKNCKKWSAEDVAKALMFHNYFTEHMTLFLLSMLSNLFLYMSPVSSTLKSNSSENIFDNILIENLLNKLKSERDRGFLPLFESIGKDVPDHSGMTYIQYREFFIDILNRVIQEIQSRFLPLGNLEFCHMLSFNKHKYIAGIRSEVYLKKLDTSYGPFFNLDDVKQELILHRRAEIPNKSIEKWYEMFLESNIKPHFPSLLKVIELTLTLPIKRAAGSENFSKLKTIAKWAYDVEISPNTTLDSSGDKSVLCVEIDFLQELKKNESFYDEVITAFNSTYGTIKLS